MNHTILLHVLAMKLFSTLYTKPLISPYKTRYLAGKPQASLKTSKLGVIPVHSSN